MSPEEIKVVIDKWAELNVELGQKYTWVQVSCSEKNVFLPPSLPPFGPPLVSPSPADQFKDEFLLNFTWALRSLRYTVSHANVALVTY